MVEHSSPSADPVLPLSEETASIEKTSRVSARVRVRTRTETIEQVVPASLESERAEVTRVPVGREVDAVPEVRTEGDVVIVPIVEEVLVIEKRLVLKDELHIRKTRTSERVEVPVPVRRQRAVIERTAVEEAGAGRPATNATDKESEP